MILLHGSDGHPVVVSESHIVAVTPISEYADYIPGPGQTVTEVFMGKQCIRVMEPTSVVIGAWLRHYGAARVQCPWCDDKIGPTLVCGDELGMHSGHPDWSEYQKRVTELNDYHAARNRCRQR